MCNCILVILACYRANLLDDSGKGLQDARVVRTRFRRISCTIQSLPSSAILALAAASRPRAQLSCPPPLPGPTPAALAAAGCLQPSHRRLSACPAWPRATRGGPARAPPPQVVTPRPADPHRHPPPRATLPTPPRYRHRCHLWWEVVCVPGAGGGAGLLPCPPGAPPDALEEVPSLAECGLLLEERESETRLDACARALRVLVRHARGAAVDEPPVGGAVKVGADADAPPPADAWTDDGATRVVPGLRGHGRRRRRQYALVALGSATARPRRASRRRGAAPLVVGRAHRQRGDCRPRRWPPRRRQPLAARSPRRVARPRARAAAPGGRGRRRRGCGPGARRSPRRRGISHVGRRRRRRPAPPPRPPATATLAERALAVDALAASFRTREVLGEVHALVEAQMRLDDAGGVALWLTVAFPVP